jgi:aspartokinase-like uncharacterized kinase
MSDCSTRVVKVGGSLFDFPDLVPSLRGWLAAQPHANNVLVAGGGKFADAIREADGRFSIGEESSHWLCIEALRVSARLLAAILPEAKLIATFEQLMSTLLDKKGDYPVVFCPRDFMREVEPFADNHPLPHTWSVTTDSIAARLADLIGADELVLLKPTDPPSGGAMTGNFVDEYFSTAARDFPNVRFVNLWA